MTNEPYRDEPPGPSGGPPPASEPEPPPEAAWMPPGTSPPTAPSPSTPPPSTPTPAEPYQNPTSPSTPYQGPQYEAPQYQTPQYQTPQYQTPQYQTPQYQSAQYQVPTGAGQAPPPGGQRPTNSLAVAALVCAVAGVITIVSAPVGAVLGHLALRQIAQTGEEGANLAKAAIWVGWIITGLVVVACCALFALVIAIGRGGDFGPR